MRILLDTCTFLWLAEDDRSLSAASRTAFQDPDNEAYLSAASAWEIAIKHRLGKLPLPEPPALFVPRIRALLEVEEFPITEEASLHAARLPDLHRDPFDRLLVCQAVVHGMTLLTPDPAIQQYAIRTIW